MDFNPFFIHRTHAGIVAALSVLHKAALRVKEALHYAEDGPRRAPRKPDAEADILADIMPVFVGFAPVLVTIW